MSDSCQKHEAVFEKYHQPEKRKGFQEFKVWKWPENSDWKCYLFGSDTAYGLVWTPAKGKEPNWFWRKMQWLCFGNKWVKDK